MSKQDRLQARALRYIRKRIYNRLGTFSSESSIRCAFFDEYFYFKSLKRFSKLDYEHRLEIYNMLNAECDLCVDWHTYGKD